MVLGSCIHFLACVLLGARFDGLCDRLSVLLGSTALCPSQFSARFNGSLTVSMFYSVQRCSDRLSVLVCSTARWLSQCSSGCVTFSRRLSPQALSWQGLFPFSFLFFDLGLPVTYARFESVVVASWRSTSTLPRGNAKGDTWKCAVRICY